MKNQPSIEACRKFGFRNPPETLRYFYHPDHIGSTSWVTDNAKNGIQYCEYLPFGEPFLDQRSTTWSSRYTFSGKERDGETGYSYFGARYYNSDISIWLSVDPMADKYPNLTPYAYCSNRPIRRIDPDGLTDYDVDGNIHTINDGNNNLRINVSQRQFNRLERKFNKGGNSYNSYRSKIMDKNGYFTFYKSTYTTPTGDELPSFGMHFHTPKGRGGFRFIDNNNSIPSQSESTNQNVTTIDVTGVLEIVKSWVSTLLEMFGPNESNIENLPDLSTVPSPQEEVPQNKSKYIDFTVKNKNGTYHSGSTLIKNREDSISKTDDFKRNDKRYGTKTTWK